MPTANDLLVLALQAKQEMHFSGFAIITASLLLRQISKTKHGKSYGMNVSYETQDPTGEKGVSQTWHDRVILSDSQHYFAVPLRFLDPVIGLTIAKQALRGRLQRLTSFSDSTDVPRFNASVQCLDERMLNDDEYEWVSEQSPTLLKFACEFVHLVSKEREFIGTIGVELEACWSRCRFHGEELDTMRMIRLVLRHSNIAQAVQV